LTFVGNLGTKLSSRVEALSVEFDTKVVRLETDHGHRGRVGLEVLDDKKVHIFVHSTDDTTSRLGVSSRRDEGHAALSFNHIQHSRGRDQLHGKDALQARLEILAMGLEAVINVRWHKQTSPRRRRGSSRLVSANSLSKGESELAKGERQREIQ
jgi:hypothetical protein